MPCKVQLCSCWRDADNLWNELFVPSNVQSMGCCNFHTVYVSSVYCTKQFLTTVKKQQQLQTQLTEAQLWKCCVELFRLPAIADTTQYEQPSLTFCLFVWTHYNFTLVLCHFVLGRHGTQHFSKQGQNKIISSSSFCTQTNSWKLCRVPSQKAQQYQWSFKILHFIQHTKNFNKM